LGTDWHKAFRNRSLPYNRFRRIYVCTEGKKKNNYYVQESVGLATGFLLSSDSQCRPCLTHTPSPMNFISKILNRPANENPFY
jgi:hypothetical protein